eukprot:jgi/Botrbrau1/2576/Bobra.145_1s0004.1
MGKKGFSRKAIVKSAMSRSKEDTENNSETVPDVTTSAIGKDGQLVEVNSASSTSATPEITEDISARFLIDSEQPSTVKDFSISSGVVVEGDGRGLEQDGSAPSESKGQMVGRHKRELKAMKEKVKHAGKKEKDDVRLQEKELLRKHAEELLTWETAHASLEAHQNGFSSATASLKGPTRAQKRREQRAAIESRREERIARELAERGESAREIEEQELEGKLKPQGLAVHPIQADGHCMYRALSHQLQPATVDHLELRNMAGRFIREHPADFLPYLSEEEENDDSRSDTLQDSLNGDADATALSDARLDRYCAKIEQAAAWGGELELQALSSALKRTIHVFSADMDVLEINPEFAGDQPPLQVCFLRHAYGLGEHYNSVVRRDEEDEEGEEDCNVNVKIPESAAMAGNDPPDPSSL